MSAPPRWPTRVLEAALPPGPVGRSIAGDLAEEWHRRSPGPDRTAWYVGAALSLAARYAAARAAGALVTFAADASSQLRKLVRHPLQNGLTVLALGLGIAAPATMFSIVEGLTRDIEVDDPERLVHVGRRWTPDRVGITRFDRLWPALEEVGGFEALGYYALGSVDVSGEGGYAERRTAVSVTPEVFRAFGRGAAVGRVLEEGDANRPTVVLGWEIWRSRFGGDPSVVGRTVRVDGTTRTVVGVMPRGFRHPSAADLWLPLDVAAAADSEREAYLAVGRRAPGTSLDEVVSRVAALDAALRDEAGADLRPGGAVAAQSWRDKQIAPRHRRMLVVMLLVVSFVLVIACADVVNLLRARALGRSRETAVRVALGAGRWRLVGGHLAEAAALAAAGGLVGLGLTAAAVRIFEARTASFVAHWMDFRIDGPVLLFAAALVVVAALATGFVPALQSGGVDVAPSLRDGDRSASTFRVGRLSRWLVAGEVALSCTLLVLSGIMVRGALTNLSADGDYPTESVLTAGYELRSEAYPTDDDVLAFHRGLVESLEGRPGVAAVALASDLPGVFSARRAVEVEGRVYERPEDRPATHVVVVSPSFFGALGARVLRGREPTWDDGRGGPPVALVNEAFARAHLAERDPVGARVRMPAAGDSSWATVVGVVPALGVGATHREPDIDAARDADGTGIYLALSTRPSRFMNVLVRAAPGTDPLALLAPLREAVAAIDPDVALHRVDTLAGHIATTRAAEAVFAVLFVVFGLAGLLLASVGLYGLLAFTVRRRTREIGVRTALGASPPRVLRAAIGSGLVQLAAGLAGGLALAALLAPLLQETLLGADPRDPIVYATVAGVLALVGVVATLPPAARALRVDVVEALRSE